MLNYQIVTGSTGSSISISFIEVYGDAAAAPTLTGTLIILLDGFLVDRIITHLVVVR